MAPEGTMLYNGTKLGLVLDWKQPVLIGGGRMPIFLIVIVCVSVFFFLKNDSLP